MLDLYWDKKKSLAQGKFAKTKSLLETKIFLSPKNA